jgi:hypothetical protein
MEVVVNPILIAILCLALVALLYVMLRHAATEHSENAQWGYAEWGRSGETADGSRVRLPPRSLLNQCLSADDLDCVQRRQSRPLLRLFLHERRRLALAWLTETKREAQRLLRLHVHSVRFAPDVRLGAEAKLAISVALFLVVYAALRTLVWWYGPWQTRQSLKSVQALFGVLAQLADRIVGAVIPVGPQMEAAAGPLR